MSRPLNVLVGCEYSGTVRDAFRALGHNAMIHDDVWTFTPDGRATGLIASPPCQTFSAAGKGSGRKALDDVLAVIGSGDWASLAKLKEAGLRFGDDRTALVLTPLHFATGYEYEWLAWEQVPAVLPVWEACAEVLRSKGWHVWTGLLQAEMYGVPQTRKRAFLLASLHGPVELPAPAHSRYYSRTPDKLDPGVRKWVSMAEALGRGLAERPSPTVTGGGTETGGAEPIAKLARYTGRPDWCASPSGITGPVHRPVSHPAATVTGAANFETHDPADCRRTALDSIRITVAEAGILQSFPAAYPWQGNKGKQYLQAGNAVPPLMALHALSAATGISAQERVA